VDLLKDYLKCHEHGGSEMLDFLKKKEYRAKPGGEAPAEAPVADDEGLAAATHVASDDPDGPPSAVPANAPAAKSSLLSVDFPALYDKMGLVDEHTDSLLEAFVGMVALPPDARKTAILTMAKSLHDDPTAVTALLAKRLKLLQAALDQEKKSSSERAADRAASLAALRTDTEQQVAALEAQIKKLRSDIDETKQGVAKAELDARTADAEDVGSVSAYETRVRAEATRLREMNEVFGAAAPGKAK
jgi:hypothetical protein